MSIGIRSGVLFSNRQISIRETALQSSFEKLASGRRINKASDDAASLSISASLQSNIKASTVATRNISDGISLGAIAEGALSSATNITGRLAELAAQASNGVLNDNQRQALNQEYQALKSELDRIGATTEFNGQNVFRNPVSVQSGIDGSVNSQTKFGLSELSANALGLPNDISTQDQARQALNQIGDAATQISSAQAQLGTSQEVLEATFNQLQSTILSKQEVESRLGDADLAQESANLTASNIGLSAASSIEAQANIDSQVALQLLS